ncbi:hypothetical protein PSCLAVI8L_180264 [Pseudoclavibacter sp. 8L]|nr:hypothetical protein PSCLAVI8L_180264 [Pseudoclavibacter sp. 8L]
MEGGQGPPRPPRLRPLRRTAAASLHRPRHRCLPRRAAHGRALLGPRPDLDARDRGPHRGPQDRVHDRHRDPQHAAGIARLRQDRVLQHRWHRDAGQAHRVRHDEDDLREPVRPGDGGLRVGPLRLDPHSPDPRLRPRRSSPGPQSSLTPAPPSHPTRDGEVPLGWESSQHEVTFPSRATMNGRRQPGTAPPSESRAMPTRAASGPGHQTAAQPRRRHPDPWTHPATVPPSQNSGWGSPSGMGKFPARSDLSIPSNNEWPTTTRERPAQRVTSHVDASRQRAWTPDRRPAEPLTPGSVGSPGPPSHPPKNSGWRSPSGTGMFPARSDFSIPRPVPYTHLTLQKSRGWSSRSISAHSTTNPGL